MARLVATGKKPKVVIVAVMRNKMITMLNAMLRDDTPWVDRSSGRHSVPTAR